MSFDLLLDAVLGERQLFHVIECSVCGHEEIYYIDPETKQQIGRACSQCGFVQKFEFEKGGV
ncbi:acyltransferase [Alkalihalobacterium elongatum]|uniref:acyltransferase n=1 Tax=Alkalihalobacterium elongatum TaxID=2675466 RepID=UPI001C1FE8A1|nr:acyltransferase [Alkalihalobacterium elongatum]